MGDHGASAIIPANIILMSACAALAIFTLPWWMTLGVVVLLFSVRDFARDQYGGMQLSLLLLPGLLAGILAMAQFLQDAKASDGGVQWLRALALAIVPIMLLPAMLFVTMAVPVAAILGWEWIRDRIRNKGVR